MSASSQTSYASKPAAVGPATAQSLAPAAIEPQTGGLPAACLSLPAALVGRAAEYYERMLGERALDVLASLLPEARGLRVM